MTKRQARAAVRGKQRAMTEKQTTGAQPALHRRLRGRPVSRYAERTGNSTIGIGLEVLRIVGRAGKPATLTEIARQAGMSLGRTSRYISSLTQSEFLCQNEETGRIDLGPAAFELGMFAMSRIDVVRLTRYLTRRLSKFTKFGSIVCVWRGDGPVVDTFEPSPLDLSIAIREGARVSLIDHAAGQIFLAYEPASRIQALLAAEMKAKNRALPRQQRSSAREIDALRRDIRQAGLAQTGSRDAPLLGSIAAPVFDREGRLSASVGLVGLTYVLDQSISQDAVTYLKRMADRLTARLQALGVSYQGGRL